MAYASLVSVAQTINQIQENGSYSISPPEKQKITSIHKHLIFLQSFLEEFPNKANRKLEGRIRKISNQVEDKIEYFIWEQSQLRYGSNSEGSNDKFEHHPQRAAQWNDWNKLTEEMDAIAEEVMKAIQINNVTTKDVSLHHDDSAAAASSSSSSKISPSHKKKAMVGFDDDLLAIKERLCGESSKLQVIPIVGMGGIGKTTLARSAYDDPLTMQYFDIRAWVTVSQDYSAHKVFSELLNSMKEFNTGSFDQTHDEQVYKILKGRKYLIVMDDMWSTEAWDDVWRICPDDDNGSRIMLTTRLSDVAAYADPSRPPHEVRLMDNDQSWDLLRQRVFIHEEDCTRDLEEIGREIARSCGGLPLALVVIAGVLSSKSPAFWVEIAENINSAFATTDGQLEKILSLSYTHLPHHLRPCFLYMGAFPEDYEIHARKLIKLWVAEGFIKSSASRSFEEGAYEYLQGLVIRNLVIVSRRNSNGEIKTCSIHDIMRELCMRKAKQEKFLLHVTDGIISKRSIKNQRRLCINGFNWAFRKLYIPQAIGCGYDHLNFSHSEETVRFPAHVFKLFHLKYLAFYFPITGHGRRHVEIPAVISNLENLQTIIFPKRSHQTCIVDFPSEIWRMPQLRHIICFYIGQLPNPEEGATSALENLQTLSEVRDLVCTARIMKMIPNVSKLGLFFSGDETDHQDYQLENLEHLQKLEKLKLTANGTLPFRRARVNPTFPKTLKKLTLSGWELSHEDMPTIGSPPNLQVLKLIDFNFDGGKWETTEGGFCQLKFLLLHYTDLGHWITESSHFPVLKCLLLHHCPFLSEIPDGIGEIPTLELIEVKGDDIYLAESAKRIQEEQREYGNDALEVLCVSCIF